MTKSNKEIDQLLTLAKEQQKVSRAPDFWQGIEDALLWMSGESVPTIDLHLMATNMKAGR